MFYAMICTLILFVCIFHDAAVFAEFSFTCVIDLVSALEYDGIISGFMQFYQKTVGPFFPEVMPYALAVSMHKISSICCHLGRTISGNCLCHYDVLLGWNRALHHVPGDDQQDNRQVGHMSLICAVLHQSRPASAYHNGISSKTSNLKLMCFDIVHFGLLIYIIFKVPFHLKMTVNS